MEILLNDEVNQFIKSQKGLKADVDSFAKKNNNNNKFPENAINCSIKYACNDVMYRTMTANSGKGGTKFKEDIRDVLGGKIKDHFIYCNDESDFNTWHYNTCVEVLNVFEDHYTDDGTEPKHGKAQKLVNMTFKYLYCFANDNQRKKYFQECHMPIDSAIFEWIKRECLYLQKNEGKYCDFRAGKMPSWSKMDYSGPVNINDNLNYDEDKYTYNTFYKIIIELVKNIKVKDEKSLTPLQAEFIIWPRMQLYLASKSFIKQLEDNGYNVPSSDDKDPLCKNLNRIKAVLRNI